MTMTRPRPSTALLLAAFLAALARAPSAIADGSVAAVALDLRGGAASASPLPGDDAPPAAGQRGVSVAAHRAFLRTTPPSLVLAATYPTPEIHAAFDAWRTTFDRAYGSAHEGALRKLIWHENHALIEAHNAAGARSHALAHNDFSDLTNDEFRRRNFLGEYSPGVHKPKGRREGEGALAWLRPSATERKLLRGGYGEDAADGGEVSEADEATVADVPDYKNWTAEGAVTRVKNQWFCGACWAYSAVGAIEGIRYVKTSNLTELSMQQLVDCDKTDLGCHGGLMDQAFSYEDQVGLCSAAEYPMAYHRHYLWGCSVSDEPLAPAFWHNGNCRPLPHTRVRKFVDVAAQEEALKDAIATQPVSVAVAAGDWQFYAGGVLDTSCEERIDHGVLAVGYGSSAGYGASNGSEYWLIKNSWGETWGEDGYIRLARGIGNEATNGTACVLTLASRPIMSLEDDE